MKQLCHNILPFCGYILIEMSFKTRSWSFKTRFKTSRQFSLFSRSQFSFDFKDNESIDLPENISSPPSSLQKYFINLIQRIKHTNRMEHFYTRRVQRTACLPIEVTTSICTTYDGNYQDSREAFACSSEEDELVLRELGIC